MARSSLQLALRDVGAGEGHETLHAEIEYLIGEGVLPAIVGEWSNEIRKLGNEAAHPAPDAPLTDSQDAIEIVNFLDLLLEYLYVLPSQIKQYRLRRSNDSEE